MEITNIGELKTTQSTSVLFSLDNSEPQLISIILDLDPGETLSTFWLQELEIGQHQLSLQVEEVQQTINLEVQTAELTTEILDYRMVDDGIIELDLEVTNNGTLTAENVNIDAEWNLDTTMLTPIGTAGTLPNAALIQQLKPQERRKTTLSLPVQTGIYTASINVNTSTLEINQENNSHTHTIQVEYVQLQATITQTDVVGYLSSGHGTVEIQFSIINTGQAESGAIPVGVLCTDEAKGQCSHSIQIESVLAGATYSGMITVPMPQGTINARIFAAELEESFRWGKENYSDFTVEVPAKPPLNLAINSKTEITGYWSDRTANVELDIEVRNKGYQQLDSTQRVRLTCTQETTSIENCGPDFDVSLPDGFGPTQQTLTLRLPIGTSNIELDYGNEEPLTMSVQVPDRIFDVNRREWECFSDNQERLDEDGYSRGFGCSARDKETIIKWDQSEPIRIWATGAPEYIQILQESINELAPILNLEFQWVARRGNANFIARVGIPDDEWEDMNFGTNCEHAIGCAQWKNDGPKVYMGYIWILLNEISHHPRTGMPGERVKATTIHELIHALVPIRHRTELASIMRNPILRPDSQLSQMDKAIIHINQHHLVESGMTMEQIEALIVFDDQLLDAEPSTLLDPIETIENTHKALIESGSATFSIKGSWSGRQCSGDFGWATYEIGNLIEDFAKWQRFKDGDTHFYLMFGGINSEYWRERRGEWRSASSDDIWNNTSWRRGFTSPLNMLISILYFATPDQIEITETNGSHITIEVELDRADVNLSWASDHGLDVRIVIDSETHQMTQYEMNWTFEPDDGRCEGYHIQARNAKYGIPFEFPDHITQNSQFELP